MKKRERAPDASPFAVADLAYTTQYFYSEVMTELLNRFHAMGISDNLALGGGCGLNSSYNGQIVDQTPLKQLHVPSAPADDGNALGVALLASIKIILTGGRTQRYKAPTLAAHSPRTPFLTSRSLVVSPRFSISLRPFMNRPPVCWQTESSSVRSKGAQNFPRALGNRSFWPIRVHGYERRSIPW